MRQITVSVLSLFIILPALADARLPVVNISAGGVSARAAFGEPIVKNSEENIKTEVKKVAVKEESKKENTNRAVVARTATAPKVVESKEVQKDVGQQILASADVLVPRRPSSDLWARNDTPLRLPQPEEFSVIKSDFQLPEESIDGAGTNKANRAVVARSTSVKPRVVEVKSNIEPMSEIDAQIARLNELQRKADESVKEEVVARRAVAPVKVEPQERKITAEEKIAAVRENTKDTFDEDVDVKLSRMVVPMDEDVIVRSVQKAESPRVASVREDMTKLSPTELRKAFRKTFLSENKHLSTFQIDDRFDVASDMTTSVAGFTSQKDLSESGGIRPLEIKIKFRNEDAALSRDNYNLLTEYASIVLSNPTRAVQVSIPESVTRDTDDRKLAARRLAIIEQVLRDTGISEQRILPVLSQRDEDGLVLRMISLDQYETLTKQQRDMFGDTVSKKTYKSMSW